MRPLVLFFTAVALLCLVIGTAGKTGQYRVGRWPGPPSRQETPPPPGPNRAQKLVKEGLNKLAKVINLIKAIICL